MKFYEKKSAGYKTIAAYFLGLAVIYPMTMLVTTDFVNEEIRKDQHFEDG